MKTRFTKVDKDLKHKIANSTRIFSGLSLVFLIFLVLLSAIEITLGSINHSLESDFIILWGWSCLEDLKFWIAWLFPVYLCFLPLHLLKPRILKTVFKIIFILGLIIQLLLVFYYNTTLLMLGSDLFGYSLEEIMQTVGSSGSLSLISGIIFFFFISILVLAFLCFSGKIELNSKITYPLLLLSFVVILFNLTEKIHPVNISSDFERGLITNKSKHFYTSAYAHFHPDIYEPDIYAESYIGEYLSKYANAETIEYIDETDYPFLHKEIDRDVLSPFFETKVQAPNIVIIMVEGLGRAFTNKGAYLGNFTPFLDSLSTQSLYWPNFLSNGGRTFAVLPSLLGSLPFAENGFMEMENKMPNQISILNLLQNNGYKTSFFYGGNSEFDNMGMYLRKNRVDAIYDENDFTSGYSRIPASASGFSWGYGDKELFRFYLDSKKKDSKILTLDVLLTVSMHSPFLINETEKYNEIFERKIDELGFSTRKKEEYRNYKKQYTSILFTDDALKNLLGSYKKRADFENTIFIITGDHRIPEIPMASKLDRYHVPMIIYSPLLKRTAEFESISSHFDLVPSLVAFLKKNFDIKAPDVNGFVGRGLDTTRNFQNIHNIPLKQTKTEMVDFVMGAYHLNGDDLYKLTRALKEEPVEDDTKKEELKNAFNQFRRKNSEIIHGKKILPDSLMSNYISR